MVDGLFFCATLKSRRGGHTPILRVGAEASATGAEGITLDPRCSWQCHSGFGVLMPEMRVRSLVGLSTQSSFHWRCAQCAAHMLLSDRMKSCCICRQSGCLYFGRHAFPIGRRASIEWSRCLGSVARRSSDSKPPLRRSSVGWMPARMGRLCAGVGRRHPVTFRQSSLMAGSIRRVCALLHQTGAQYCAVECTSPKVTVRNVIALGAQPEPPSRFNSATSDVSFLRIDSKCWRYVSDVCDITLRHLGSDEKGSMTWS